MLFSIFYGIALFWRIVEKRVDYGAQSKAPMRQLCAILLRLKILFQTSAAAAAALIGEEAPDFRVLP